MNPKIWTIEEAREILPRVKEITGEAFTVATELARDLEDNIHPENLQEEKEEQLRLILTHWAEEISSLGIDVKGLWLADFDNGSGYYCWKYGEDDITFEHTYQGGFSGRKPIGGHEQNSDEE